MMRTLTSIFSVALVSCAVVSCSVAESAPDRTEWSSGAQVEDATDIAEQRLSHALEVAYYEANVVRDRRKVDSVTCTHRAFEREFEHLRRPTVAIAATKILVTDLLSRSQWADQSRAFEEVGIIGLARDIAWRCHRTCRVTIDLATKEIWDDECHWWQDE